MRSLPLILASVAATVVVAVGMGSMPYAFYTILRIVLCAACVVGMARSLALKRFAWAWAFGFAAVLYNPVLPVHLGKGSKGLWIAVNCATLALLWLSVVSLSPVAPPAKSSENGER